MLFSLLQLPLCGLLLGLPGGKERGGGSCMRRSFRYFCNYVSCDKDVNVGLLSDESALGGRIATAPVPRIPTEREKCLSNYIFVDYLCKRELQQLHENKECQWILI